MRKSLALICLGCILRGGWTKESFGSSHLGSRSFRVPSLQFSVVVMMVTACWRGGECLYLQRRRCFFSHSAEKVAAALLVGDEASRVDVLELAADVQGLRRLVQRLARTITWDRDNPAATAVAKSAVEARPPEVARDETLTETVCANAADATVGEPVGEARRLGIAQSEVEGSTGEAGSS